MCHSRVRYLLIIIFFAGSLNAFAQTTASSGTNSSYPLSERENNPYSKYGIGEIWDGNNAVLKGMGSMTSAFANPLQINSDNPASYSYLERVTFEAGATGSIRTINGTMNGVATSYSSGTFSLDYLTIAFPVSKHTGLCMGFKPFSKVYYNLADTVTSPIGRVVNSYSGAGALSYAYLGAAHKFGGFSIGANVGYMFGTINATTATVPIDTFGENTAEYTSSNRIGGIYWKAGAMYEHKIDSDYTFRIGATLALQQNLQERFNAFQISTYNFSDTIINDTMANAGQRQGKITLPMVFSIGAMLVKNNHWDLGLDYSATQWSGFHSSQDADMNLGLASSSYRIALGGDYTPDITNIRNYLSRCTYRFGLYYGSGYLNLAGTALPDYGFTVGASLPFRRSTSQLHAALVIGSLGTTSNNLLQETYFRFTLGFSFNDRWFIPRKYD